ncbi:bifunctional 4-hydroxy-2-oxoglutarate aldolase/2-dehydro-3-deoxy-phosphogluconate aldolase [Diplocloster hominis]|uniref:bifunctional 4-hydroxy-2-oxoglutarate aldolase/2-dehydro-3-deoxy-phosphogluconate aldolase n=1 Tax=Diplocloster hominis TaxID=3079010 RepID=UPI0031BBB2CD
MNQILQNIHEIGIVPVIVIDRVDLAVPLAKILKESGMPCAEIAFRTDEAAQVIGIMKKEYPDMLVGAGTVLTIDQVKAAVEQGADFIVSPGFNPSVVQYCVDHGILIMPGAVNPSDVERALELGLEAVKFFPVIANGGLDAIRYLSGPYSNLRFMPTGGIHTGNMNEYLDSPIILAVGGDWMVEGGLIKEGSLDKIKALVEESVSAMLGFELAHVGMNCGDEKNAKETAEKFSAMFGIPTTGYPGAVFAGTMLEAVKHPAYGTAGHIGIYTNSVERAVRYLKDRGCACREESRQYREDGRLICVYLEEEINGFAVHLLQK